MQLFSFEPRTVIVIMVGVSLILSITMNMILQKRKTYPGFGWWTAGITAFTFAFIFYPLRNIIPDIFSIVLSNILFILASLLFLEGTRRFHGKEVQKTFMVVLLIAFTIFQSYFTFVCNDANIRIMVVSFILATMFGLIVLELLQNMPSNLRFSYWYTGSMFAIFSIFMFVRGILTWMFPPSHDILTPGIFQSLTFMLAIFLGIGWIIGFIIMTSERLENDLKSAQIQLQRMASTDFLTGIANNRFFLELGKREIQRAHRHKSSLAALMIDLDYFKKINDIYGHAIGDEVLVAFADICKKNLRDFDIFGRLGGEEFAILLPQTEISKAKLLAERLCAIIAQSDIETEDKIIRITVSIGVSGLLHSEDDLNTVLKRADDAMYEAKSNGRNQVAVAL